MASAAASRSASGKITCGFLPPSSSDTFFSVPDAAATIRLPTPVEPVKLTISTRGSEVMIAPTGSPYPSTILTTPAGTPASISSSPRMTVVEGVISDGFTTAVQPAASAKGSFWLTIRKGKFHGVMMDATPIGSFSTTPSISGPRLLWLSPCTVRAKAAA